VIAAVVAFALLARLPVLQTWLRYLAIAPFGFAAAAL
jgi:hypothetical protein